MRGKTLVLEHQKFPILQISNDRIQCCKQTKHFNACYFDAEMQQQLSGTVEVLKLLYFSLGC